MGPSLVDGVVRRLDPPPEENNSDDNEEDGDEDEDEDSLFHSTHPEAFVAHLHPSECTSVMLAMKALVLGFVQRPPNNNRGEYSRISIDSERRFIFNRQRKAKTSHVARRIRHKSTRGMVRSRGGSAS